MNTYPIPDRHQNFWQLMCIQAASQSIPAMLIGHLLAKEYGAGTAICSIVIGNLVLWVIGLAMVSMTAQNRQNAIENAKTYLGKNVSFFAALVLMIAFLCWYMINIKDVTSALGGLFQNNTRWLEDLNIRLGAGFGLLIALLSIGGIRLIRRICVIAFPVILVFNIYAISTSDITITIKGTWGFSFPAIVASLAITLPGFINLPTFFRHSRSKADSFLALALITIFDIFFQLFSIFVDISDSSTFIARGVDISGYVLFGIIFCVLSLICLNLVNIYFASAGLETIISNRRGSKEYAIIGLLGTAAFTFLQASPPMLFLMNISESFIASLGIVLLLAFLTKLIVQHRPRKFEKFVNGFCWLVGCITSTVVQSHSTQESYSFALAAGVFASIVTFLSILIIEETVWAVDKLLPKEGESK